jgi:DNA-binding NarL/FixJ family response regulator
MPVRVAIVDDDPALLESLGSIIAAVQGFECPGRFGSVEEALPHIQQDGADILLLDIQLPGISGDQAIGRLREACPSMRVLMLTVFSDRDRLFRCLCNGAHGYLLKSTPPAKLLEAIAAARDGGSPFSPEIARHIATFFQKTGPSASLAAQEQRLLSLLAEGYSYQAAADRMHVSVNTVRNYVRNVYEKLHVHSKSAAVSRALRKGLI